MGKKKQKHKPAELASDAELLEELATLDEVTAVIPTAADQDAGRVPSWCELEVNIRRVGDGTLNPIHNRMLLRRHDGELIIEVLDSVLHPNRGGLPLDQMWTRLDEVVERIQRRVNKGRDPMKADVGEARGLVHAIAVLTNPMEYDEDEVRAVAMERYDIRHGISGVPDDA